MTELTSMGSDKLELLAASVRKAIQKEIAAFAASEAEILLEGYRETLRIRLSSIASEVGIRVGQSISMDRFGHDLRIIIEMPKADAV